MNIRSLRGRVTSAGLVVVVVTVVVVVVVGGGGGWSSLVCL